MVKRIGKGSAIYDKKELFLWSRKSSTENQFHLSDVENICVAQGIVKPTNKHYREDTLGKDW